MPFTPQSTSTSVRRAVAVALIGSALVVADPTDAHAYLDAGTGSMIIQVLIASIAGALFFLKSYWRKVKSFFSRGPAREAEDPGSHASSDGT